MERQQKKEGVGAAPPSSQHLDHPKFLCSFRTKFYGADESCLPERGVLKSALFSRAVSETALFPRVDFFRKPAENLYTPAWY